MSGTGSRTRGRLRAGWIGLLSGGYARPLVGAFVAAEILASRPPPAPGDALIEVLGALRAKPAALPEGDADEDGLADAEEAAWARKYAPIVLLDEGDACRPSSIAWLSDRVELVSPTAAIARAGAPAPPAPPAPFPAEVRRGADPSDWTTYVHAFPRADGGVMLQYWFFYPYNDGPGPFDHEGDWEHATVRLDARGEPVGVYLARHEDNAPGRFRAWSRVRREGDHPIVLSARGTHATYFDAEDAPWFERVATCDDLDRCPGPVWRTWEGGGLVDLGERKRPSEAEKGGRDRLLQHPGRWGAPGLLPGTSGPLGPLFQRGFCFSGYRACEAPITRLESPAPAAATRQAASAR